MDISITFENICDVMDENEIEFVTNSELDNHILLFELNVEALDVHVYEESLTRSTLLFDHFLLKYREKIC